MALHEELTRQGNRLFKLRSYVPLAVLPLLVPAVYELLQGRYAFRWSREWWAGCLVFSLLGLVVRTLAVGYSAPGTSGRNTGGQRAASLNTTGPYSLVRHPLYLGNFTISLGILAFIGVWWLVALGALLFWMYYERIMYAEEQYLREKFGDSFRAWADRTPAILPRLRTWDKPSAPFSWRKAIRGEYATVLGISVSYALIEAGLVTVRQHRYVFDTVPLSVLAAGLLIYLTVRIIAKTTSALKPGKRRKRPPDPD